jgi:hypothetical protein
MTSFEYSNGSSKDRKKKRQTKRNLKIALDKYDFRENPNQLTVLDRVKDAQIRKRASKLPRKCFEYSQQYDIVLPSAPALRSLPRKTVDSLVNRLYPFKKDTRRIEDDNEVQQKLSTANKDNQNKQKIDSFRRCSYCDSHESISARRKHSKKTPQQVQDMIDRLSVAKLHDSDFRFGKLIRFRSVRSLSEYEDSPSHFQSMTSLTSGLSNTCSFPTAAPKKASSVPKLPPINSHNRTVSSDGVDGLTVTVTLKNKPKSVYEKSIERLIKSSSLNRNDMNLDQSARSIQSL